MMDTDSLPLDAPLRQLAQSLAGEFDNRQQSLADPAWFLHLRVWNRPLPPGIFSAGYGFFIEQVNVATGQPPYRQRILQLKAVEGQLLGQYYALRDALKFCGSSTQPERLQALNQAELVPLPTCCLTVTAKAGTDQFQGRLPEDSLCRITIEGQTSYISLGFDIGPVYSGTSAPMQLTVYDHGVDATTGATTWGPRMGPFRLRKTTEFELP